MVKRKPSSTMSFFFFLLVCVWIKCSKSDQNAFQGHFMCVCVYMRIKEGLQPAAEQYSCLFERLLPLNESAVCLHGELTASAQMFTEQHTEDMLWPLLYFNPPSLYLSSFSSSFNLASLHWLAQYLAGSQNTIGLVCYLSISSETGNLHDLSAFLSLCRLWDYDGQSSHIFLL